MDTSRLLNVKYVEYGTRYATDTCFLCWLDTGETVEATWEAVNGHDERTSLCSKHAEEALKDVRTFYEANQDALAVWPQQRNTLDYSRPV
jgi:hypothetical protein